MTFGVFPFGLFQCKGLKWNFSCLLILASVSCKQSFILFTFSLCFRKKINWRQTNISPASLPSHLGTDVYKIYISRLFDFFFHWYFFDKTPLYWQLAGAELTPHSQCKSTLFLAQKVTKLGGNLNYAIFWLLDHPSFIRWIKGRGSHSPALKPGIKHIILWTFMWFSKKNQN